MKKHIKQDWRKIFKQFKSNWVLCIGNWKLKRGFSLVELLVIISIISIMSSATVAGLGRMREVLVFRESVAFLNDVIKNQELKVLRGDYEKIVVHFLENYLVIEEYPVDAKLKLNLFECVTQNPGEYGVKLSDDEGILVQKSSQGIIQTRNLKKGTPDCQTTFSQSEYREISYQLTQAEEYSVLIRLVHFNLKREAGNNGIIDNPVYISAGAGSRIELFAPYSKKMVYNHNDELKPNGSNIEIKDRSGSFSEKITL